TLEFINGMAEIYRSEHEHSIVFKEKIRKLFGEELRMISLEDDSKNDSVLESNVFSKSVLRFLVKMKNKIGTGKLVNHKLLWRAITKDGQKIIANKEMVDGFYMVVMDYVKAEPLYNCSSLSCNKYKAILRDIKEAIDKLHEKSIVFADLCDSNILVDKSQGQYKRMLIDFDWASKDEIECSPSFMNHKHITEEKTKDLSETVSLQELNSKLIVIIAKLRRENSEIKTENIELKAENSMVCNQIVTNISQDVEPEISDSYPVNSNNVPEDINLLCDDINITNNASNSDKHQEETLSRVSNLFSTVLAICVKPKSLEDKKIDNFLIEKHNEQIRNKIREKKLQYRLPIESSPKEDIYISNIKSSIPLKQKKKQGLIQEISTFIKDQNNITRISQNNVRQNHITEEPETVNIFNKYNENDGEFSDDNDDKFSDNNNNGDYCSFSNKDKP
ncbi:1228_t:CDS:2, partial [Racocetra persica]